MDVVTHLQMIHLGVFGLIQGKDLKAADCNGVTVIELLMVLSTIVLLLAVGVPRVEDIAIRARVNEGLAVATAAREAVNMTCVSNPSAKIHDLDHAGFGFEPTQYVAEVLVVADCSKQLMWVGVITRNTGADSDPYVAYISSSNHNSNRAAWQCRLIKGREEHVPAECSIAVTPAVY